ncbi:hypothetical protein CTI14_52050, partial [Methylobacterium radiotolerans]
MQSHTSALAGDRRVYAAAFRQLNVIEATDFAQYLEYLAADPQTEIVLGYIEQAARWGPLRAGVPRTRTARQAADCAEAGATDKGAQAVQSHTSALAGDRRVYAAAFRQLNVIEATDFAQ